MVFELMYNSINYIKTNHNSSEFLSHRDDSKEFCPGGDAIYFPPEEETSFAWTGGFSSASLIAYRCSLDPLWEHFFFYILMIPSLIVEIKYWICVHKIF